ncbi:uncharacterized protein [Miscanthus floridulus]|uniref:uncharacterized protein n=1 Tax=Miscanthus floridulus TaxID=154761 RepID=UPI0034577354
MVHCRSLGVPLEKRTEKFITHRSIRVSSCGGSRPLVETQQYLEAKHGPRKGTIINAFSCMKAGLKNCDANGNASLIPERAKKLVDDYNEALEEKYPENWQ